MKHLTKSLIALFMAVLIAVMIPVQVLADGPEYVSEVKIGIGSTSELEKEGYTVLKDNNGKAIDLNTDAGGGYGSEGDQEVYLGYKTTADKKEALTDLALMNMKGGYSVQEYEALMETQMKSQIIPFVDSFLATIKEYRENYTSDIEANRLRAQYIHDLLNKLTDDDCGGKGLGDLFLNETKYEMGIEAYNKLSEEEKAKTDIVKESDKAYAALSEEERQNHADILTIIAQSNGRATIMMQNLLTRGADTDEESWIDRFIATGYDDLLSVTPGRTGADKAKALAKQYDDDAQTLLEFWDDFRDKLLNADETVEAVVNAQEIDYDAMEEIAEAVEDDGITEDNIDDVVELMQADAEVFKYNADLSFVAVREFLEQTEYGDGTLLDFFMQSSEELEDDITVLYPLVASLSDGERAGIEFVSLEELIAIAAINGDEYQKFDISDIGAASVYTDVDRGIYQKGGVALTSDALRADALARQTEQSSLISPLTIMLWSMTAASAVALVGSLVAKFSIENLVNIKRLSEITAIATENAELHKALVNVAIYGMQHPDHMGSVSFAEIHGGANYETIEAVNSARLQELSKPMTTYTYLSIGFGVAMVALTAVSTYMTFRDMQNHYKVDFTPIPHYMVDEKDLISYNKKGERIILKNQSAYYKAVESTMKKGDFKFDEIGNLADMNGCVGQQWLALYAAKTTAEEPILANSFKVVVGSANIPAGYDTGIHMFGSDAAFNLNDSHYDWNDDADSVYVYFQRDDASLSAAGTGFSGGTLAIGAAAGLALGVLGTVLVGTVTKKRKAKAVA